MGRFRIFSVPVDICQTRFSQGCFYIRPSALFTYYVTLNRVIYDLVLLLYDLITDVIVSQKSFVHMCVHACASVCVRGVCA